MKFKDKDLVEIHNGHAWVLRVVVGIVGNRYQIMDGNYNITEHEETDLRKPGRFP